MADHPHLEAEWLHAIALILIATKRCLGLFAQLTQLNVACELVGRLPHASFSQLIFARYFINEFLILRSGDARR